MSLGAYLGLPKDLSKEKVAEIDAAAMDLMGEPSDNMRGLYIVQLIRALNDALESAKEIHKIAHDEGETPYTYDGFFEDFETDLQNIGYLLNGGFDSVLRPKSIVRQTT